MKTLLVGDRLGGVLFDVQTACEKMHRVPPEVMDQFAGTPDLRSAARERLVLIAAQTVMLVMQMDAENRVCADTGHDRYGQRMVDCSECRAANPRIGSGEFTAEEQASITTSLADLTQVNTDIQMRTLHDDREPPRKPMLCKCETPNCNTSTTYPKPCYTCGGIVVER